MKKFLVCLLLICLIGGGVGGYFYFKNIKDEERIAEIKKGWYVEVIYKDPVNVRSDANSKSELLGKTDKNGIYKALDVDISNNYYNWYKIEFKGKVGWIASGKKTPWVKDVNNPNDIADPIIKYYEDVYTVRSIDDINYKHLEIIEDSDDYKIEHVVYHEVNPSRFIDQYWILYTVTDRAGKSTSKLQKIEFAEKPDEARVIDFVEYKPR